MNQINNNSFILFLSKIYISLLDMLITFHKNFLFLFQNRMVHHIPSSPLSQQSKSKEKPQLWKMTCLRPAPPSRSSLNQNEATPGSSNKRNSINAKPSARKGNFTHYLTEPTFLTKSLQKNCLYVHEKLRRKPPLEGA